MNKVSTSFWDTKVSQTIFNDYFVYVCFRQIWGSRRTRFADVLLFVETGVLRYYLAWS